jgi:hypothetical protein
MSARMLAQETTCPCLITNTLKRADYVHGLSAFLGSDE